MKKLPFKICGLQPCNLDKVICFDYGKTAYERGERENNAEILEYAELFLSMGMEMGSDECRDFLKDKGFF